MLEHQEVFAVDAAIVHELGQRLIGRPAIALGELVKNAYDADASVCRIEFGDDQIVVSDDGTGMSNDQFLRYWMRIGTTHKVDERVSPLGRPLTGSKGIGRLSAQFLANELTLESTAAACVDESLFAIVDWRDAVPGANLNTVNVGWEMRRDTITYPGSSLSGTRITLKNLKSQWDAPALRSLGEEVWMLRSPFKRPPKRSKAKRPEDFEVDIQAPAIAGARDEFDKTLRTVLENWKARIEGRLERGRSGAPAIISVEFRAGYPDGLQAARRFRETVRLPIRERSSNKRPLVDRVTYEILIFKPQGRQPGGISVNDLRDYLSRFGNVSVYDTGFRLPYYGSTLDAVGHDWLAIAADQGSRLNVSPLLPEHLQNQNRYMQDLPAPGRIFGAVDIDTNHERVAANESGTWLQIQSGRDRLHDDLAFAQLRDLVRFSLDFYANRFRVLDLEIAEEAREAEPPSHKYARVEQILERSKEEIPGPVFRELKRQVAAARTSSAAEERAIDSRAALLAPLASAGMIALALNHEIARESSFLELIARQLRQAAQTHSLADLEEIAIRFDAAKARLDSIRELFSPLLSETDRSATDRLRVRVVVDQVIRSMRVIMPAATIDLSSIPQDLRFPLGSLAEWNAVLQNVFANAWNAMLDSKTAHVLCQGGRDGRGREWLRISDTGQGLSVPPAEAGGLFEPFARRLVVSDDSRSLLIGGHGLGLAIVRMIAHQRAAKVGFIEPGPGFSTTIEISWRGTRQ